MVISSQVGWVTLAPEYLAPSTRMVEGSQLSGRFTEHSASFKRRGITPAGSDFQSVFKRVLDENSKKR